MTVTADSLECEAARLRELHAFQVLDTPPDEDIDELTTLAAALCDTPIALVSLVDADRQWFKSHVGLATTETARNVSFCAHAIRGRTVFEVRDASLDRRFSDNPLVTDDPRIRFYAGTPLVTHNGHALGALCVIDQKPREMTDAQRRHLELVGRQVMRRLEQQKAAHELHLLNAERAEHLGRLQQTTDTLAASEHRLALVLSTVEAGFWDWDLDGGRVTYNDRFAELFELPAGQSVSPTEVFDAVDDEELEALHAAIGRLFDGRVDRLLHTFRKRRNADAPVWLALRGQVVERYSDGQPRRALGIARDITAERAKDDQLQTAQKLDSIGALAAGVAHEINTPLQFVSHNLDFLASHATALSQLAAQLATAKAQLPVEHAAAQAWATALDDADLADLGDDVASAISESVEGIERVTTIVRALKEFSHPGGQGADLVDMNHMIENAITLSRNEWKFAASVQREFDPALPPIECAAYECGQVLVNLLVNAAHAVAAAVRPGERGLITVRTRAFDGQVEIQVQDTGTGVPPAIRDRIFEPFFTTKGVGKGTGQGLATARAIVERHGGTIRLETETGRGTTFFVTLPAAASRRAA